MLELPNDAFHEGIEAYYNQKSVLDNPYPINSSEYLQWSDGWYYAINEATMYYDIDCQEI